MHARSLMLLLAAVAALAALTLWQLRREDAQQAQSNVALLEGFERGRVTALRIDNLERSLQMRIEREPAGRWMIVDPLSFPVEPAVLEALFSALESQHLLAPLVEDRSKLRLSPPRVVLEVTEDVSGQARVTRIELGEIDIGEQLVYVLRDGRLGRTERALDTVLERDLPDWRSHYVMGFDPRNVVELTREGRMGVDGEEPLDITLQAVLDGEWRSTKPFVAQLDPRMVAGVIGAIASLRAEAFIDAPGPLAFYGLEEPAVRLTVVDVRGMAQSIRLSPEPTGEMWYATREDQPYVYRVGSLSAGLCLPPSEGLVELGFARVSRSEVQGLEYSYDGRSVSLARTDRVWRVSGKEGEVVVLDGAAADEALVEGALSLVEQARIGGLDFSRKLEPSELRGRLTLRLESGEVGGVLGPPLRTADGVEGVLFRRDGDELVGMLSPAVLELVRRDAGAFQSLVLHKVLELDVSYIVVSHAGVRRKWLRDEHGHWVRDGMTSEAKEFSRWVDRILSMRASAMLKRADENVDDPLEVEVTKFSGDRLGFTLGTASIEGVARPVYRSGSQFAVIANDLHSALAGLLGPD